MELTGREPGGLRWASASVPSSNVALTSRRCAGPRTTMPRGRTARGRDAWHPLGRRRAESMALPAHPSVQDLSTVGIVKNTVANCGKWVPDRIAFHLPDKHLALRWPQRAPNSGLAIFAPRAIRDVTFRPP